MNTLVLFDIDGTLIESPKSHKESFKEALEKVYKIDPPSIKELNSYEGTTDQIVLFDVLKKRGLSEEKIKEKLKEVEKVSISLFNKNFKNENSKVLPGIYELLNLLKDKTNLGLITGNLEDIAWIKMKRFKLDKFFKTGGFGSDAVERKDIVKAAINKSESYFNEKFDKIVLVGDTTHDIEAAKFDNIITIGVATGIKNSVDELKKANPDYVFESFKDYKKVAEVILK